MRASRTRSFAPATASLDAADCAEAERPASHAVEAALAVRVFLRKSRRLRDIVESP
jgi:hypothetical protein